MNVNKPITLVALLLVLMMIILVLVSFQTMIDVSNKLQQLNDRFDTLPSEINSQLEEIDFDKFVE